MRLVRGALLARILAKLGVHGIGAGSSCECSGDVDGNGRVDVDDIIDVITSWGDTGNSLADVNNDNVVDATDLVIVLAGYGSCL